MIFHTAIMQVNSLCRERKRQNAFDNDICTPLFYCILLCNHWGLATQPAMKPIMSLSRQALTTFDQMPVKWHHCRIQKKYNLFSRKNFIKLLFIKFIFKYVRGLAPELVSQHLVSILSVLLSSAGPTDLEHPAVRNTNIN